MVGMPSLTASVRGVDYFCSFSIPLVGALPFFDTQQKASFEPQVAQTCFSTSLLDLPWPSTVDVVPQPGQVCCALTFSLGSDALKLGST